MFKWIYQVGVKHENERIRRLIAEFTLKTDMENQQFNQMIRDKSPKPDQLEQYNINRAALKILDELMRPEFLREYTKAPIDGPKGE